MQSVLCKKIRYKLTKSANVKLSYCLVEGKKRPIKVNWRV